MEKRAITKDCALGVDIGGTKIKAAALDINGAVLHENQAASPAGDQEKMVEAFKGLLHRIMDECRARNLNPKAVGVASAGYVLQKEGIIVSAPNIAFNMVPLRRIAAEATGIPAFLDNDANAAAAGERLAGVAKGSKNFVYLTLGTGVGGGVYANGLILRGSRGMAAELGHIVIDPRGPACGCGRRGCLEAMASGNALGRIGSEIAKLDGDTLMVEMAGGDPASITGRIVTGAAAEGDAAAVRALEAWSANLASGIVDYIHIFDPEMVVLGGGVAESGDLFIDSVRDAVAREGIGALVEGVEILITELGNEAGVVGAAALAWEELERGSRSFTGERPP